MQPAFYVLLKGIDTKDIQERVAGIISEKNGYRIPLAEFISRMPKGCVEKSALDPLHQNMKDFEASLKNSALYAVYSGEVGAELVGLSPTPYYQGKTDKPLNLGKVIDQLIEEKKKKQI